MKAKKKRLLCLLAVVILLFLLIFWLNPTVFARDGLLTRLPVDDYLVQWDAGSTRRHDADIDTLWLFCISSGDVSVQREEMYEGYDVEVEQVMPFLYRWKRTFNDTVFRVTVGDRKYYFTIVSA
ncbi:hypothetical protein [Eubacterium sp. ER2]|uniref:hypothetical protein n=1 Tax=Eubacterium sp. ER2 TaxID=1519438 RepID=UPI00051AB450|nr:hypothetical protein [Eubacterium sp. ER2]